MKRALGLIGVGLLLCGVAGGNLGRARLLEVHAPTTDAAGPDWGRVPETHVPFPSVRIAVIADTHIGSGKAADELRSLVQAINGRRDLDYVFVTGDVTEKGRDEEFKEAKEILAGLRIPYLVAPGNHDAHWIGAGLAGFAEHFGRSYFSVEKGKTVFLLLNSSEFGHFSPEQADWLAETVSRIPPDAEVFVLQHFPPEDVDNWGVAHNLLRLRKSYVVCGHVHRSQLLAHRGIPVLTVRAAVSTKDRGPGFAVIENAEEEVVLDEAGTGQELLRVGTLVKKERPEPAPPAPDDRLVNFGVTILAQSDTRRSLSVPAVVAAKNFFLARSSADMRSGEVEIWDSEGGRMRATVGDMAGIVSRPAVTPDGRRLYAADVKGSVFLIDVRAAKVLGSVSLGERVTSQLVLSPAGNGRPRSLIAGTVSGRIYCLDAKTLRTLWVNGDAAGAVQTRPLVAGGRIVYGAWDGHLYCLDAATGETVWTWTENDNFYYSPAGCVPATDGARVFVCSPDGHVSAVDLKTGATVWRENHGAWESLGLSGDRKRLFVKGVRDEFSVVDAGSGRLLRKTQPAQGETDIYPMVPVERRGGIVYGAMNGHVYMIDKAGAIRPLVYLGAAPVIAVERVGNPGDTYKEYMSPPAAEDTFAAFNMDGQFVIFKLCR